ncbi:benzoate/H(+) symporter BenE family transporter [Streptomyces sp. NPDC002867]
MHPCIGLSLRTRMPVITAWSTPGAALLVTSLGAYSYAEAVGAFLVTGAVITLVGLTGVFGRLIRQVPGAVVSAMLAGILFSFGAGVFTSLRTGPWMSCPMSPCRAARRVPGPDRRLSTGR